MKKKKSLDIDQCFEVHKKKYPAKMKFDYVVDTHLYDEWLAGLTEQQRIDYYNKEVKKGEANL